jgi:hypothetical protein
MARDRDAADITVGAQWPGRRGGAARVLDVSAGYVRFVDEVGRVEIAHQWQFRQRYLQPYDARRLRSWFAMCAANLIEFHVFWSSALGRSFARTSTVAPEDCAAAARGRPALPPDAKHVGTYAQPVSPDAFFEDLNDVLATEGNSGNPAA